MENRSGKTVCIRCFTENVATKNNNENGIKSVIVTCLSSTCGHVSENVLVNQN